MSYLDYTGVSRLVKNTKDYVNNKIDDENSSTDKTYSSSKIDSLVEGAGKIDDENVTTESTFSSSKIKELIADAGETVLIYSKNVIYDDSDTQIGVTNVQEAIEYLVENGGGGGGLDIPPNDVTNIAVQPGDGELTIAWHDPLDTYLDGYKLSAWKNTMLVMNDKHAPTDEKDGTILLTNDVRDKYATSGYHITGLTNNKIYYFYFVPTTTNNIVGYSDNNRITGMPAKVMLDDVTDISISSADKTVTVNWTNPPKQKIQDGITANWVKTTVVIKAGSQPVSVNDGTAYVSTNYSEGTHNFTVENGKDYYVGFFIESDLHSVTNTTYSTATSLYSTVTIRTEEASLIGKDVLIKYGNTTQTVNFGTMGFVQSNIPFIGEVEFSSTNGEDDAKANLTIEEFKPYAVELSFLKIVTFADGTDEEIIAMLDAHYADKINISDYWSVGDTRNVQLSAMGNSGITNATSDTETHSAQTVQMVIIDFNHDDLVTPINGHTKSAVTLHQKDCMKLERNTTFQYENSKRDTGLGSMNNYSGTHTNAGGWDSCARRTWCNNAYKNALPTLIKNSVKKVNKLTSAGNQSSTIKTSQDDVFLLSEIEIFGTTTYSFAGEGNQYEYFKLNTSNSCKNPKWSDSTQLSARWWERSPYSSSSAYFCFVNSDGTADSYGAGGTDGLAPAYNL